jgi:hypothetical protein
MAIPGKRSLGRPCATLAWCVSICLAGSALWACNDDAVAPDSGAGQDAISPADAAPDGQTAVTYQAVGIPGGLDRILITRADPASDLCVGLRLVWPDLGDTFDIALPPEWSVEFTYLYQGAATCHDDLSLPMGAVPASAGSGAITWDDSGGAFPGVLSIDVTLTFSSAWPWVPDSVDLVATDLSVSF